jgi:hypothetical protein
VSSKARGGTITFCGASGAPEAALDALLLDATDEATLDATLDEATLDATLDDATLEEATLDATEEAVLDEALEVVGSYEHQVEVLGAPGKVESWQTKLPVSVA